MPFQKGNTLGGRRPSSTKTPVAGDRDPQPAGELKMSGNTDERQAMNELAALLNTPIVKGGGNATAMRTDESGDDDRSGYTQQSYVNDPVHDDHFDTSDRDQGPLALPINKIEIDGTVYHLGWQRWEIAGKTDHKEMAAVRGRGWEPVPMDRLPSYLQSYAFKSDLGDGYYISQDCILMMIPEALYERNMQCNQKRADVPMDRVMRNLEFTSRLPGADGIANRSEAPTRQTFTGRTATAAVQDAIERGGSPSHGVRGFRVR